LHLALVHKVHRVKPDLKDSKEPQDHPGRQDQQARQDLRGQKATQDPKVLPVQPVYLVQRFI
jgi:hypothetical protein